MTSTNKPSKSDREAEALLQVFANQARIKPISTDLSHLDKLPPGVAPLAGAVAPAAGPAAPVKTHVRRVRPPAAKPKDEQPVPAPAAPTQPVASFAATIMVSPAELAEIEASRAARKAALAAPPWASANPKIQKQYVVRMSEELHMKLAWIKAHVPNASFNKQIINAMTEATDAILAEYYEPSDKN